MSFKFDSSILRAYDIRGIIGESLSVKDALVIGKVFASEIKDRYGTCNIVVGYDGRLSSPILEESLVEGLIYSGASVTRIGMGPSPMLYYASSVLKSDGAIMITGSHNPSNYNGFKLLDKKGSIFGKDITNLGNRAKLANWYKSRGRETFYSIKDSYVKKIVSSLNLKNKNISVAWDAGNGSSGEIISKIIKFIPGRHILINGKVDGTFPSHHPDPTIPKNLSDLIKTVKKNKLDLGIGFDGDGDRLGVVDGEGNIIFGDQLLYIYSEDLLKKHPKASIIADVKASQVLFNKIKSLGGIPIMWKTGHSYIKYKMKKSGALLAGEMSGHIFFADDYYGYDDAIYASVRLLNILSEGKNLKDLLHKYPKVFSTPEIRIECSDELKFRVIERCKNLVKTKGSNLCLIDGIRVTTSNGWWLVRASNTQPAIVVRCESNTKKSLICLLESVSSIIESCGLKSELGSFKNIDYSS